MTPGEIKEIFTFVLAIIFVLAPYFYLPPAVWKEDKEDIPVRKKILIEYSIYSVLIILPTFLIFNHQSLVENHFSDYPIYASYFGAILCFVLMHQDMAVFNEQYGEIYDEEAVSSSSSGGFAERAYATVSGIMSSIRPGKPNNKIEGHGRLKKAGTEAEQEQEEKGKEE